ncbi:MAG: mechanosensitive ion channel family protein [Arenicella sp.]
MDILSQLAEPINNIWTGLGAIEKSVIAILLSISIFYFLRYIVIRRIERITARTENDLDDRLVHFIKQFLWVAAFVGTLVWVLKINGIAVSPILAGAGIFGVAVGFAAKETIADILSGIFLIVDRPIRIGDRVTIDRIGKHWGGWGDIVDIGLRRTVIRNTDGVIVNYPNSLLSSGIIKNFSIDPKPVRARVRFQVDYSANPDEIRRLVFAAITKTDGIIPDTATIVIRSMWDDDQGHQLSGVLYEARYILQDVKQRTTIRSQVLENIILSFQAQKIPMASHPVNIVKQSLINE